MPVFEIKTREKIDAEATYYVEAEAEDRAREKVEDGHADCHRVVLQATAQVSTITAARQLGEGEGAPTPLPRVKQSLSMRRAVKAAPRPCSR